MSKATLIIENARVLTMDPDRPRAEAVAIGGAMILGVGSREDMDAFAGPDTRRFDAQGKTVLPGFVESHLHIFPGSLGLKLLHLDKIRGVPAFCEAVQATSSAWERISPATNWTRRCRIARWC